MGCLMQDKVQIETPVLLITFNRPDLTKRILEVLSKYNFTNLIIVSDGPRNASDVPKINKSREIIQLLAPSNSEFIFRSQNLGCRSNVYSSLMYAINKHESLIVLEDDCLPGDYFFSYCTSMLKKYEGDRNISHISGTNPQDFWADENLFLSKYPRVWGWACWRRSLVGLKDQINLIPNLTDNFNLIDLLLHFYFYYCIQIKKVNTWDYQYLLHNLSKGFSIVPRTSLVENIGFRDDATHTIGEPLNYTIENNAIDYSKINIAYDENAKKNDRLFAKLMLPIFIRKVL